MSEHAVIYVGFAVAGWLFLIGLYGIVTSKHLVHLCICLAILQASTYVLLTTIGYREGRPAPIFTDNLQPGDKATDPVIAAMMLTDVVVEATVMALLLAIAMRIHRHAGSANPDEVNVMRG